jgi:protein-S-isoprenylcysteine O-methyltransferase Ste14
MKDHRIVREGIYRFIRHPAYAGSICSFIGLGVFFGNYLSVIVIGLPVTAAFLHRIRIEEKVLTAQFANEYADYSSSTKRLIPGIY